MKNYPQTSHLWHPYTQMKTLEENPPIEITRAQGLKLYDTAGNFYYDTISSWWCNLLGHNHPKVTAAINQQLKNFDHIIFGGFTHKPAQDLAKTLVKITPNGLEKVFFSDNGSTAVEVALKMSFQYWQYQNQPQKQEFISLENGYHGDTIGAMSLSGVDLFNQTFSPLMFKSHKLPCPNSPDAEEKSLATLKTLLQKSENKIAALIIEPLLMGAGGMIIYSPNYLKEVRELTKKHNVHLIADEIAVGFGRTGKLFACEHAEITPDYLCLSKALTNGTLPLAVTLTTQEIFNAFYADPSEQKTFYHGHTFTANAIACAAANATLEAIETEQIMEKLPTKITKFKSQLKDLSANTDIQNLRSIGMIAAFETRKGQFQEGLAHNLILRPLGNTTYLYLPLSTTKEELDDIFDRLKKTLLQKPE